MRVILYALIGSSLSMLTGCVDDKGGFEGPTVDKFDGKLVHKGEPISLDGDYRLELFHEKGQSFAIPLKPDGSFQIGWMPIGSYSATLIKKVVSQSGKKGSAPYRYSIPEGLSIKEGQSDYTIELGPKFKK